MAIKRKNMDEEETRVVASDASSETQAAAPDDNGETQAIPKRRGGPRGPRGPRKPFIWTNEMDAELARTMKDPSLGSIKTAGSVASALAVNPVFDGQDVTPARVKQRLDEIHAIRKEKGLEIKPWSVLSQGRRRPDVELFGD